MTYYEIKRFPPSKRNFPSKQACYANRHVISSAFFGWFSGKTTERRDVKFGIHVYGGNVWGNVDAFSEKIISFKVMGHYVTNCKIVLGHLVIFIHFQRFLTKYSKYQKNDQ